ncbi:MAG: relaxase/mobilization nuclease domain-containing protein [Steroidobacteraceae bacterium]
MVKVTGGGASSGTVSAHLNYISRQGELEIETDEGDLIGKDGQKPLLKDWHLELSAGQYRGLRDGHRSARKIKLVHNIVLSMPAPTPPGKVLAAARLFAREKFGGQHRYALVMHTDQQHPHVHMVIKAESERGRHLHIDKALLRQWRDDFARTMREQGVAANATPRAIRGRIKGGLRDSIHRARQHGSSSFMRQRVTTIARELGQTGAFRDPARPQLLETRKAVLANWNRTADTLDAQGEATLAGEVRHFARHLPPVLTDRERLAAEFVRHLQERSAGPTPPPKKRGREDDLVR